MKEWLHCCPQLCTVPSTKGLYLHSHSALLTLNEQLQDWRLTVGSHKNQVHRRTLTAKCSPGRPCGLAGAAGHCIWHSCHSCPAQHCSTPTSQHSRYISFTKQFIKMNSDKWDASKFYAFSLVFRFHFQSTQPVIISQWFSFKRAKWICDYCYRN